MGVRKGLAFGAAVAYTGQPVPVVVRVTLLRDL